MYHINKLKVNCMMKNGLLKRYVCSLFYCVHTSCPENIQESQIFDPPVEMSFVDDITWNLKINSNQ